MGTPCRCCGKVICISQDVRFDHDRYNYNGSIAFVHITQTISHNIDNGGYQQVSQEEYFFQDEETIACNFSVEHEATLTDPGGMPSSPPTMVKTVTSIVRKFVLRYSIGDVFDWGESNREDHLFINSIFIRGGESESNFTRVAPTDPIEVPGIGSGSKVGAKGKLYIASGRRIDFPQSMEDWNNLARGKPSYNFDHDDQDEIFINQEDIDENNDYYVLVECPQSDTMVKWGNWFGGAATENGVTKRAFIELRRITDIETCDKLPALQDHKIEKKEDLDDWHTLFSRTADGTYMSKNTYMDKELNFGDFFKSDFDNKFFLFCGELQLGVMNPNGGQYLDLLYKIEYDREAVYVSNVDFPTCQSYYGGGTSQPANGEITKDSVTAEITDPLNFSEKIKITKSKSELSEAPTEILNPLHSTSRTGDYTHATYEFTPPYNANVHRFKYNVVGGEDRFNGDDYILQEMISDYRDCENIKFLKVKNLNGTWGDRDPECPALHDYVSFSNNYSGGLGGGYPLKDILKRTAGSINGLFIRPCVIESSKALLLSEGPDRRIFDTDIARVYNYVPHYGSYSPSRVRFIIRNHEFYPYKLKLNDINDACPKECIPTEHIPEWQLLSSSFACAGSPAIINEMIYGANGGLSLSSGADIFACCAKLSSVRQLKSCMGKYSINTSYAMRVANYIASSPSVWELNGGGIFQDLPVFTYPMCSEFHRPEDQLALPNLVPCGEDRRTVPTPDATSSLWIGTSDVCGRAFSVYSPVRGYKLYTNLHPSYSYDPDAAFGSAFGLPTASRLESCVFTGLTGYSTIMYHFSHANRKGAKTVHGTEASDAYEYSTGQLEYAKTCLEKSLDVEGYDIENEFAEEHLICVNEISFGETFSVDKEIQRGKSDGFNARQQSDVVIKDPSCGEGLRWRVDTDNVGVYETLFDYDSDEDVSHACYFYEKGQLDLIYQQYVPAIEFAKGREAGVKMRSIADCVAGYLTTFNYWYQIAGTSPEDDIIIALDPSDDNYSETEIRSDQAGIEVLEIHKEVGDLVERGEKVFTMKTGDINVRNEFGGGNVDQVFKRVGDTVSAGDIIMITFFGQDTIKEVLAPEDGEITGINVSHGDPISRRDILATMITKKTIVSPVKGAINRIEVEEEDIVFLRQFMAAVGNTVTYPAGSYVKVKPNGEFEAPLDNHSMYQNENYYEVEDVVEIEVDGVWTKGRPAERDDYPLMTSMGSHRPGKLEHQGDDEYKFTFFTDLMPSAYSYDYGVKDDRSVEMGNAPSEFFSDLFIPVLEEVSSTWYVLPPLKEDSVGRVAGECSSFILRDILDGKLDHRFSNSAISWELDVEACSDTTGDSSFSQPPPPCGFILENNLTGYKFYKTSPGVVNSETTTVTVQAPTTSDPRRDGCETRVSVDLNCYLPKSVTNSLDFASSPCRNNSDDVLNFCNVCNRDLECIHLESNCPGNYTDKSKRFECNGNLYILGGKGLDMKYNGPSQDIEFINSARQATGSGWDYTYTLGDQADASYGETETYRCFTQFNFASDGVVGDNAVPYEDWDFITSTPEFGFECLVSTEEAPCPDGEENYNIGSTITATYRKIVLKSKFNKCGDDRLPNLNYSHKDLVDTSAPDKTSFPKAAIAKSVALSEDDGSLDSYDITEEQKEKINDKLSELDKKYMRGDVDAPVNVTSTEVDNLCGQGVNFRRGAFFGDGVRVECRPENYIPSLHADKLGTVINHFDKLQAFYDAVSDAGLSKSVAEKILDNYLYGSLSKGCSEHMRATGYGRRFIVPHSCTDYEINNDLCPEDPENVCTQVDENKPLPVPDSSLGREGCEDLLGQFALDIMGYVPPENVFLTKGAMIKPIEPSSLESDSINPTMKGEVTKKMCSLKDYSFTIGD